MDGEKKIYFYFNQYKQNTLSIYMTVLEKEFPLLKNCE